MPRISVTCSPSQRSKAVGVSTIRMATDCSMTLSLRRAPCTQSVDSLIKRVSVIALRCTATPSHHRVQIVVILIVRIPCILGVCGSLREPSRPYSAPLSGTCHSFCTGEDDSLWQPNTGAADAASQFAVMQIRLQSRADRLKTGLSCP